MHTREQIEEMGFETRGTYQGPFPLDEAVKIATQLRDARREDGEPVFNCLVTVRQGAGYNVIEISGTPIEPGTAVRTYDDKPGTFRNVACTNLWTGRIMYIIDGGESESGPPGRKDVYYQLREPDRVETELEPSK